jgi:hypothetical protein
MQTPHWIPASPWLQSIESSAYGPASYKNLDNDYYNAGTVTLPQSALCMYTFFAILHSSFTLINLFTNRLLTSINSTGYYTTQRHKFIITPHRDIPNLSCISLIITYRHIGKIIQIQAMTAHIIKTIWNFFRHFIKFYLRFMLNGGYIRPPMTYDFSMPC